MVIKNIGNYLTKWKVSGDYNKFLKIIEMKCLEVAMDKFKIPHYRWELHVEFTRIPKEGRLLIQNIFGDTDRFLKGEVEIEEI